MSASSSSSSSSRPIVVDLTQEDTIINEPIDPKAAKRLEDKKRKRREKHAIEQQKQIMLVSARAAIENTIAKDLTTPHEDQALSAERPNA